jgi:hypothetical protein
MDNTTMATLHSILERDKDDCKIRSSLYTKEQLSFACIKEGHFELCLSSDSTSFIITAIMMAAWATVTAFGQQGRFTPEGVLVVQFDDSILLELGVHSGTYELLPTRYVFLKDPFHCWHEKASTKVKGVLGFCSNKWSLFFNGTTNQCEQAMVQSSQNAQPFHLKAATNPWFAQGDSQFVQHRFIPRDPRSFIITSPVNAALFYMGCYISALKIVLYTFPFINAFIQDNGVALNWWVFCTQVLAMCGIFHAI